MAMGRAHKDQVRGNGGKKPAAMKPSAKPSGKAQARAAALGAAMGAGKGRKC